MNPFLWFIFAIVLPLIIASIITVIVLSFSGIDVIGWATEKGSTMPVISKYIKTDEEKDIMLKLDRAEETIEKQKEEIEDLKSEIESLEAIKDQQEQDIVKLENKTIIDESAEGSSATIEVSEQLKQTAGSFRKMDEQKAADIIQNLDKESAVDILEQLSNDVRGKIMEEMEPKNAADLTKRMLSD